MAGFERKKLIFVVYEERMDGLVDPKPIWKGDFKATWTDGESAQEELEAFGLEYKESLVSMFLTALMRDMPVAMVKMSMKAFYEDEEERTPELREKLLRAIEPFMDEHTKAHCFKDYSPDLTVR